MTRTFTIRPVGLDDAVDIARIYIDSWNAGFRALMPQRQLSADLVERWRDDLGSSSHHWWIATIGERAVGFVGIGPSRDPLDPSLGELDTIAVLPDCWRLGIGGVLLKVAIEQLEKDGYSEAILWTLANYPRGEAFYVAHGWHADGNSRSEGRQISYRHALG